MIPFFLVVYLPYDLRSLSTCQDCIRVVRIASVGTGAYFPFEDSLGAYFTFE